MVLMALSLFFSIARPSFVLGADPDCINPICNPLGEGATFEKVIGRITTWANAIAIPLTTIMILVAGLLYMTGGGNPERIKKAHQALIWAIVGLVVLLFSTVAHLIIKNVLGAK